MNNQQQEQIVIECQRLAHSLALSSLNWLSKATNKRTENAAFELSQAADALYSFLNNNPSIMGSDTGKPAFDEFNQDSDEDFQSDMQNLWDQDEHDYREIKRLRNETN